MAVHKQVANYWVELIGMAIFIIASYRIIVILFTRPWTELWYYFIIALFALFLMNYMHLPHHISQTWKKIINR